MKPSDYFLLRREEIDLRCCDVSQRYIWPAADSWRGEERTRRRTAYITAMLNHAALDTYKGIFDLINSSHKLGSMIRSPAFQPTSFWVEDHPATVSVPHPDRPRTAPILPRSQSDSPQMQRLSTGVSRR